MGRLGLICFMLSTTAIPGTARAQVAQGASPSAETNGAENNEILVTGEKTKRTLKDTPSSVSIVTSEVIKNENLSSVYDALEHTANVSINPAGYGFTIRGIDAFNVSGGGEGDLASVYIDGAPLSRLAIESGPLDLFDVAQMEVFRGPQSTVQGQNALAGAVIVRTADPSFDWHGLARLQMSDADGGRRVGLALGGPIVADQLAFRIAGDLHRADGFVKDLTTGKNYDRRDSETIRGKLLFTPTALPGLRILAGYTHDRHERGEQYVEFDAPYNVFERVVLSDQPRKDKITSDIWTLDTSYEISSIFSIDSVTNYSRINANFIYDTDRSARVGGVGGIFDPENTLTQEVRLHLNTSRFKALIGGYYSNDRNLGYKSYQNTTITLANLGLVNYMTASTGNGGLGLSPAMANSVVALYGTGIAYQQAVTLPETTQNLAAFGDATWEIVPRLTLVLGFRYDHERQTQGGAQIVSLVDPLPTQASVDPSLQSAVTAINARVNALVASLNSTNPTGSSSNDAFLPKAGITFDVAPNLAISFTAQRGYRSGGSGFNRGRGQFYTYDPEYTWNYEGAIRSDWFDHRLTVNANAYYIDWTNQQVSVQLTPGSTVDVQTVNIGKSRLWGGELEMFGNPVKHLQLNFSAGYSNTKFTSLSSGSLISTYSVPGNEFPFAPRWSLMGGGTWTDRSGIFVNLNVNYRSAAYQSATEQTVRDVDARTLVNGKIGWQGKNLGAFVFFTNLFNEKYVDQTFLNTNGRTIGVVGDPRVIGLSFEGRF